MSRAHAVPFLLSLSLSCGGSAPPPAVEPVAPPPVTIVVEPGQEGIERWTIKHPRASTALGEWVQGHPGAAKLFFEWDSRHPERARNFVDWTVTHFADDVAGFVAQHQDWEGFDKIMLHHRQAADRFIVWCRRFPSEAQELMRYPKGLQWAGKHLYGDYWQLGN